MRVVLSPALPVPLPTMGAFPVSTETTKRCPVAVRSFAVSSTPKTLWRSGCGTFDFRVVSTSVNVCGHFLTDLFASTSFANGESSLDRSARPPSCASSTAHEEVPVASSSVEPASLAALQAAKEKAAARPRVMVSRARKKRMPRRTQHVRQCRQLSDDARSQGNCRA